MREPWGLRDAIFSQAYYLEEWAVLEKNALSYYIRAHLEFLFEQLNSKSPDETFVWFFVHQLYQVAYMYKGSPFSQEQTIYLKNVVEAVARDSSDRERYGDYGIEIQRNVDQILGALGQLMIRNFAVYNAERSASIAGQQDAK